MTGALTIADKPQRPLLRGYGLSTLAWEMPVCIALGFGAGTWLDGRIGTEPAFTIAGLLLGVAAAFRSLVRAAKRGKKDMR